MRFPAIFLPPLPPHLPRGDKVGPVGHRHLGEMDLGPRVVAVGGAQQRVAQHVGQLLPVQATLPLQNRFKTGYKTGSKPVMGTCPSRAQSQGRDFWNPCANNTVLAQFNTLKKSTKIKFPSKKCSNNFYNISLFN